MLRNLNALFVVFAAASSCGSDDSSSDGPAPGGGRGGTGSGGIGGASGAGATAGRGGASGAGATAGRGGASGAGGSSGSRTSDAATPPDAPGGCLPLDVECAAPGATCCPGTECVSATPQPICLTPCRENSECATGCCVEYGNVRGKVCAPAAECANCAAAGQPCASARCCQGSLCTTIDATQGCAPECSKPSDCASGCCVALGNVSRSVCLDAKYCPP